MTPSTPDHPAPADAKRHRAWPKGQIVLAYATLILVAIASIWLVDRKVHHVNADHSSAASGL